jgi:PAS domain S-box-containing protein
MQGGGGMEPHSNNSELAKEMQRLQEELIKQKQIGFANGLFQEEVTIRTLLEALGQGVVIIDKYRNILLVNRRAEQMFGYNSADLVGKPHDVLLPERSNNTHMEYMAGFFREPKVRPMGIGMDLFGVRQDGSEFPVEISLSFVKTQNDLLVIALVSDISLRKQAEEINRQRSEELALANAELEAFSYSVSHDLKAPLRTIIGFSEMLLESYAETNSQTGLEYVQKIEAGAKRMNRLIDDMLQLSRIGRQEIDKQDIDISVTAGSIIDELRSASPSMKVEVLIEKHMHATVDQGLIRIALTNLLGNAWKFTGKVQNPRIEFGTYLEDGKLIYFIRDNGTGFNMDYAHKLFAPFKRLHSENEFPGSGIGLAIVSRVITRHGGKVWADSKPGEGTTFFFTLG